MLKPKPLRSRKHPDVEDDFKSELDEMMALPSLRPCLGFLSDETSAVTDTSSVLIGRTTDLMPKQGAIKPSLQPPQERAFPPFDAVEAPTTTCQPDTFIRVDSLDSQQAFTGAMFETTVGPSTRHRIRKCFIAQDGHSHIEQAIYEYFWRNGYEEPATGNRLIQIGKNHIAKDVRIDPRNVPIIMDRLVKKLSIEKVQRGGFTSANLYRVYSYIEILRRRKQAGQEWVVRGRGVEFVDAISGKPLFGEKKTRRPNNTTSAIPASPSGATAL
jgi:hypothetical protein